MKRVVKYISLGLDAESKERLRKLLYKVAQNKDFCFLRRKGGDVTRKAHLILLFGLSSNIKQEGLQEDLGKMFCELKNLHAYKLEIFKLGKLYMFKKIFNKNSEIDCDLKNERVALKKFSKM